MGCDIHVAIEFASFIQHDGTLYWDDFGAGHWNPGRDYSMFGVLAGVRSSRNPVVPLKGLPEDMGFAAREAFENDSDLHSFTWLSTDEYMACIAEAWLDPEVMDGGSGPGVAYQVIGVALQAFKDRGVEARVIIAFDN